MLTKDKGSGDDASVVEPNILSEQAGFEFRVGLGLFCFRIAVNLFLLLGVRLFPISCLLSSFTIVKMYQLQSNTVPSKGKIIPKRPIYLFFILRKAEVFFWTLHKRIVCP